MFLDKSYRIPKFQTRNISFSSSKIFCIAIANKNNVKCCMVKFILNFTFS